jgi:pimeloyl-ACP methyl ester carboxylesterase
VAEQWLRWNTAFEEQPMTIRIFRATRKRAVTSAAALVVLAALGQISRAAEPALGVTDKGRGPALVFIPGLNSASEVFAETCEAFVATHRCLLLDLPGFAGREPISLERGFLAPVKDEIVALLREQRLANVTLVGHSLGGDLAMMVALAAPELVGGLVLIDSLPFYAAVQNPALTAELAKPMAEQLRARMSAQSDEDYRKYAAASVNGMTPSAERLAQLTKWTLASDRATTTAAMADMLTTDLRASIAAIDVPVLVLGSWAAYKPYGATLESTKATFAAQYAQLRNVEIEMSAAGFHFLTFDDGEWVNREIRQLIERRADSRP